MSSTPVGSAPVTPLPTSVPSASASVPTLGASPAKSTADPLAAMMSALVPAAASGVASSFWKGAAVLFASTAAFTIAVVDLKFHLGLGRTFDAGLIGAGLSALLGKAVSL